jgi:hypothetical protein
MKLQEINLEEKSEEGADLVLLHPTTYEPLFTDGKKKMIIRLVGMDSGKYRKKSAQIANRELGKRKVKNSLEKSERQGNELLAACTIGWTLQLDEDSELDFSVEAAEDLYSSLRWVREQVDEFIADRANFLTQA